MGGSLCHDNLPESRCTWRSVPGVTLCLNCKEYDVDVIACATAFSPDEQLRAGARIQENPGANSRVFGGQAVVPADVLLGKTMAPHEFLVSPLRGMYPKSLPKLMHTCLMLSLQKQLLPK